jgi:hypothetical protein
MMPHVDDRGIEAAETTVAHTAGVAGEAGCLLLSRRKLTTGKLRVRI